MKHIKIQNKTQSLKYARVADRFDTALPVEVDGFQGLTRNICATGVYFETEMKQETGSRVQFTVEVNVRGEKSKMVCEGEVVRVERHDGRLGLAVKLVSSFFSGVTEVVDVRAGSPTGAN